MAISQSDAAHRRRMASLGDRVDGGTSSTDSFVVTPIGGVQFMTGSGVPGTEGNAMPKGSIYVDVAAGKMYVKTSVAASSGNASWVDQAA
tara:strand:+ start:4493 stop:4762 length:270 start_codon:yes stop_codon:yes gene_type:complete